jgi:hypothetical protein
MLERWRPRGEMSRIPIIAGVDGAVGGFASQLVLAMLGQTRRRQTLAWWWRRSRRTMENGGTGDKRRIRIG